MLINVSCFTNGYVYHEKIILNNGYAVYMINFCMNKKIDFYEDIVFLK